MIVHSSVFRCENVIAQYLHSYILALYAFLFFSAITTQETPASFIPLLLPAHERSCFLYPLFFPENTKNRPAHFRTGRQSFFLYFFVFHNRLHLIAVHEKPADPRHSQSDHNIQDRVLFQEHSGGNDEYSQYPGSPAHQSVLPE